MFEHYKKVKVNWLIACVSSYKWNKKYCNSSRWLPSFRINQVKMKLLCFLLIFSVCGFIHAADDKKGTEKCYNCLQIDHKINMNFAWLSQLNGIADAWSCF